MRLRIGAALILLLFLSAASNAQSRPPMSDVLILVQPLGTDSMLAVTFAKPTSPARVKALLSDLAKRGGWKLGPVEITDETVPSDYGQPGATAKQTGASTSISGSPLMSQGGYRLQPFVEAFADYGRVELLFIENEDPSFVGLKSYSSPAVKVDMIKAGSPYRYVIQIDRSAGAIPRLPLTQPAAAPTTTRPVSSGRTDRSSNSMAYVLLISAVSGLAVFFSLLLLSHLRSRRVVQPRSRRATRP